MADSATIVAASLDSSQLEQSINKLVSTVAEKTKAMADNFTSEVARMEQAIKNLGNIKIDSGGTADGGSSKRAKLFSQEGEVIQRNNQIAKEYNTTLDQQAAAIRKASQVSIRTGDAGSIRNADTLQTMNIQLDLLRERLREARQQYSSFVAMASHATTTGDKGLYQFATEGVHKYGDEVRTLIPQIRGLQNAIQQMGDVIAPQGHTIQNYVNSLQKANPELAALNEQFKKGQSALQQQNVEQQKSISFTEEESQKLQALQNRLQQLKNDRKELSKAMQDAGWDRFGAKIQLGAYPDDTNLKNKLIDAENRYAVAKQKIAQVDKEIVSIESEMNGVRSGFASSIQQTIQSAHQYTEEIRKQAQAIRESEAYKKGERVVLNTLSDGTEIVAYSEKRLSLEQQIIGAKQASVQQTQQQAAAEQQVEQQVRLTEEGLKAVYARTKQTSEAINNRANGGRGGMSPFQSYDDLRQSIAQVLGLQEQQVRLANTEKDSYNQLSSTLKKLKQAYDTLGKSDRNSDQGKALVASIHEVERAMQNIKAQSSRPINLQSVTGLSEKTLDDIAYKMRQLATYRSGLDVNTRKAEIREVNAEYDRLKKKMDEVMQKNNQMVASNNALGRSWNYMKNRLAFYFTVGASTQFIKNLIEVRSQYEMNERALGILINSAERGTQIFNELSQMALVSPYTLIELSNAAKQLTAYDIAAKDVVDTTRRLADMAAAVGVPMERLTYALGQIKAYGYLNSRDARMFANAGIPLVRELSKYYTELEGKMVSVGDVYDRMKKKAIDFNSVMSVVTKMTDEGGKFFDFQAKMADTLKVRLANLTLAWNNMLNEMGAETQGVLTTAIGGLKTLFAHWRDIDKMLKTFAWTLGMAKLAQVIQIANIGMAAFGKQMAWNIILGRKLSSVVFTLARSLKTLALSPITWITLLATALTSATIAIWNMNEAQESLNKTLRESAKDNYNNIKQFLENYDSIRNSLYKEKKDEETGKITITPIDIDKGEAKKAWEAIREQIELSSHASDEYIGSLLQIENISERVRKGFEVLDEIQTVSAALKELGDDAIKTNTDWSDWWNANLLPDGWVENLRDYEKELDNVRGKYDDVSAARAKWERNKYEDSTLNEDFVSLNTALVRLQNNIATTALSVKEFLESKEWDKDVNKINEVFKQVGDKMVQEGQLNPKDAFVFQTQWETARSQVAKRALEIRIADEKNALAVARDENRKADINSRIETLQEELKEFNLYNGKSKAYWDNFTKWLKEQHRSEMTEMFRGMDAEQIKSLNFQEGEYGSWVTRMVEKYKKENKLSNDEVFQYLHHWVTNANKWSIFIPLTISTESDKTIYQQLTEADSAIDTAYKQIERLKTRRDELAKKGGGLSRDKKVAQEYATVLEEIKSAQQDYNKALEQGGHSKKENAAASKAQKQAESELQKALKDELQLIDKVRSQYKKLTDAGATDGEALAMVTNQFANSLAHVNKVLGKNGIPLFDISKFAGTDNPRVLLDMLKLQLDSAKIAKNIKPEEIKELEVKYSEIVVDAKSYDLTKVTKGLNNELDRLKDEYELAVSLDADPELGNMFADWMGIDVSDLPRTASEYAERASKILNNKLKDLGAKTELPSVLDITDDDMRAFEENKTFTDKQLELVKKAVEAARGFQRKETEDRIKDWDKLLEKYAEYETKVNKIQNDAVKERVTFAQQFGRNEDEKSLALNLQTQILAATDPQEKQKLIEQLKELVKNIAGDDKTKINLVTAIDNSQDQGIAKTNFEEFQKSPEWIIATGELSGMTNKAIKGLIASLEKYKKTAKGLDGKQIKNINNTLKNLYREQRKENPFGAIANMIDEAKERLATVQPELDSIKAKMENVKKEIGDKKPTQEQIKTLDELKEQWKNLSKVGKISAGEWVASLMSVYGAIKGAIGLVDELAKAIGGKEGSDIERVFGVLDKAGQGAQIGAAFGGYGAAIGAVAGAATGFIKEFGDEFSGNSSINTNVKQSEINVRRLQTAFKDLEYEIEKVGGTGELTLRKIAIASREWQLAELKRQLTLEESRDSKNRDEERIEDLRSQIKDLELDLKRAADEIVNDFLGISSVGDAAENMMGAFISALRSGEDAMSSFNDSIDDMIANMLKKILATKILEPKLQEIWDNIQSEIDKRTKSQTEELQAIEEFSNRGMMDYLMRRLLDGTPFVSTNESWLEGTTEAYKELWEKMYSEYQARTGKSAFDEMGHLTEDFANWFLNSSSDYLDDYKKMLEHELANAWQEGDIKNFAEQLENLSPEIQGYMDYVNELIKELGLDASSQQSLSALQQGIQGITETTAGALEAYMNGVSQQVYYQSDLITQIRDAVVGFNLDVQVASMSQILLQLRSSYEMQTAIHSMLEGWSSPNGMSVRVEMV